MSKHLCGVLLIAASWSAGCGSPADPTTDSGSDNDNESGIGTDGGHDSTANLVFGIIGDYGDDDDNARAVSDMMLDWNLDLILTTGDNDYTDGAFRGSFEGLERGVGQYFHAFIGDYKGERGAGADTNRFFPTPGDHDWGDTCDDPAGLDDYLAYFTLPDESSGTERYYEFRNGDVHFFAVHAIEDCEPDGATFDSEQGRWLQAAAAASDAPFKVAYMHKPPYSSGDRHVDEGAHMRWPWDALGFDVVLAGDDHIYERIERDDLVYVVNGLGGVDRHGFVDEPQSGSQVRFADDYGAMRVEVYDDRMELSFVTVGGRVVDTFTVDGPEGSDGGGSSAATWYRPALGATWHWQLQPDSSSLVRNDYDVDIYDIDLFDTEASFIADLQADGRRVICYFSAGTFEDFREDAGNFLPAELGNTLDAFADERWLDVTSDNVRRIMLKRLDLAVTKGCDGVEPDNVDGYTNDPGFAFDAADQLAFNRFLAEAAHERGLAIGLKNDLEQVGDLVELFDFSVNEQCHEFDECAALQPFLDAGKPVLNAEYDERYANDAAQRAALCEDARDQGLSTLVLPLELDDAFRFSCRE